MIFWSNDTDEDITVGVSYYIIDHTERYSWESIWFLDNGAYPRTRPSDYYKRIA